MNSWCSPAGIGLRHPAYELPNFGGDFRSPVALSPTLPSPIQLEAFAVPPDDRLGLHDGEYLGPVRPDPGQQGPEESVALLQMRTFDRALQDRDLLPQCEIFKGQLSVA